MTPPPKIVSQIPERPSRNPLDESALSNDPARVARAQIANETLDVLFEEVGWFFLPLDVL